VGINLIIIGLIFLINPNIATLDVLPDFIGYILILLGTNKLYDLSSKIQESRKPFFILLFVSVAKLLSVALIPIIDPKEYTWILIFTMCFSVAEAIISIIAFYKLFQGFSYLGMMYGCKPAYNTTNTFGMTVLFISIKSVLSFVPFFSYLKTVYDDFTDTQKIDPPLNFDAFQLFNIIVVFAFGVLWFLLMRSYFNDIIKNNTLVLSLENEYRKKILSNTPLLTYRALRVFLLLLTIAVFFVIDLRFDGVDILPDFVSAALFFSAALFMLKRYKRHCKIMALLSIGYFLFSLAGWIMSALFTAKYFDYSFNLGYSEVVGYEIRHNIAAYNQYVWICAVEAIKNIFFISVFFSSVPLLKDIINTHTGVPAERTTEATIKKEKRIRLKLTVFLKTVAGVCVIAAISSVVALIFRFHISDYLKDQYAVMYTTGTVSVVLSVLLFGLYIFYSNKLLSSIEDKYMF